MKIHGKIKDSIEVTDDKRITVKKININQDLNYKVYKFSAGRLYTDRVHDMAIIIENKIVNGPSFQLRRTDDKKIYFSNIENNNVFKNGTPRKLKKLDGTTLSLLTGGAGNNNYWHWLFDVLPRLNLCEKFFKLDKIDYFLLPSVEKKFQNETLDLLNIPMHKRLSSKKFRHIKSKELIVTDHPVVTTGDATSDIQNIPNWILLWLKNSFQKENNSNGKKIYIDRDDSTFTNPARRLLSNEEKIKKYLEENNFISVKLHELKFFEQVKLFQSAKSVVGLHGGGFANITFCKPGTEIIELRSSNAGPVIENLAKKNDLNYKSIVVAAKQANNIPNQQGSIEIPIKDLIEKIKI